MRGVGHDSGVPCFIEIINSGELLWRGSLLPLGCEAAPQTIQCAQIDEAR
ncbi:hypothetical protein PGR6_39270 [Pseudomonas sp. GR 6-02]|nr:hypothetical protein PGR6_39270 [Pseudomonas sp. GR 6-02]